MPSLEETMNKLLDLFKEIANAIREKRHYDWELLIEEMPEEIRKIGVYNDWEKQHTVNVYGDGEGEWTTGIYAEGLDYTIENRFGYIVYQNDGDSDYPHHSNPYPVFAMENPAVFGSGDDNMVIYVYRTKGVDSWIAKEDPSITIAIDPVGCFEIDDHVEWVEIASMFETDADWNGTFILGGKDPID